MVVAEGLLPSYSPEPSVWNVKRVSFLSGYASYPIPLVMHSPIASKVPFSVINAPSARVMVASPSGLKFSCKAQGFSACCSGRSPEQAESMRIQTLNGMYRVRFIQVLDSVIE